MPTVNEAQVGSNGAGRSGQRPLSQAEVVETALKTIDDGGLHSLSMRGLAKKLGVFPASVYWHAGTKSELLTLLSERVLDEIKVPSVDEHDWKEWFLLLGLRTREVLGRHPRFASYFVTNIQVSRNSLALADSSVQMLLRAGFRGQGLIDAYNVVFGTVFGWSAGEFAVAPDDYEVAGRDEIERRLAAAEPDEFPALREHWPVLANRVYMLRWSSGSSNPMDSSFEVMLRTLIDGLAARLEPVDDRQE